MGKDILYPLRLCHGALAEGKSWLRFRKARKQEIMHQLREYPDTVFLLMTPEYSNLGDHAIAVSEEKMLEELGIPYLEMTTLELLRMRENHCLSLLRGRPILLTGGGNIGTLWMDIEELQRLIIRKNHGSPILILPNSAFYEDSPQGREELKKTVQIVKDHGNVRIYAREKLSYDFLRQHFPDVKLAPDMVLALKTDLRQTQRRGAILCLRSDCERTRSEQTDRNIRTQTEQLFPGNVRELDTVRPFNIPVKDRTKALHDQLTAFSQAELVVTDRLHGMIFCAITGTPCIVINSRSPKLRGCYEWISGLPYIRFSEDIPTAWEQMPGAAEPYDPSVLENQFTQLKQDLWKLAGRNGRAL